jgi:hypothetical protein
LVHVPRRERGQMKRRLNKAARLAAVQTEEWSGASKVELDSFIRRPRWSWTHPSLISGGMFPSALPCPALPQRTTQRIAAPRKEDWTSEANHQRDASESRMRACVPWSSSSSAASRPVFILILRLVLCCVQCHVMVGV